MIADHGAFNATAQPTKYPAGFFHIFTGSYDLEAAHCTVKGVYTNKAPGGVAYRCSFRVTEAVYLVERMVDLLAARAGDGPGRAAAEELHPPRAVPVRDQDRLGVRLRRLRDARCARRCGSPATTSCAREQAEKRARGELMGIGVSFFTEAVGAGPRKHMDIARARHGRRRRAARPPDRQGRAAASACRRRARATRRRSRRSSPRSSGSRRRTSRSSTATPTSTPFGLGTYGVALDAGVGRGGRDGRAQGARQGAAGRRRRCSRLARRTSSGRRAAGSSRATPSRAQTIQEIALAAHGALELPEGVEGRLDAEARLRPAEPDLPVRRLHLRRRRRPGHRRRSRCGASSPSTTAACGSTR